MAKLSTNKLAAFSVKDIFTFEIIPIIPESNGPIDAYKIIISKNDTITFTSLYTVNDWIGGHGELFSAARVLINSNNSCDINFNYSLYQTSTEHTTARALAGLDCNWLIFTTECWTRKSSPKYESVQKGIFRYFLKDIMNQHDNDVIRWIGGSIVCKIEDLILFGEQLMKELQYCLQERKRLGLEAPFDEMNDLYISE